MSHDVVGHGDPQGRSVDARSSKVDASEYTEFPPTSQSARSPLLHRGHVLEAVGSLAPVETIDVLGTLRKSPSADFDSQ